MNLFNLYNQGAAWQRLDIITAQSVFQLPKIDKENLSDIITAHSTHE